MSPTEFHQKISPGLKKVSRPNHTSTEKNKEEEEGASLQKFLELCVYRSGQYDGMEDMERVAKEFGDSRHGEGGGQLAQNHLFYMVRRGGGVRRQGWVVTVVIQESGQQCVCLRYIRTKPSMSCRQQQLQRQ